MNKILEIKNDEMVVQPGVTIENINRELTNYSFPITPHNPKTATIGGLVSVNYECDLGKASDWVKELRVVDGNGSIVRVKEKIEEYCMEGANCIIVELKLKLEKKSNERSMTIYSFNTVDAMSKKVKELTKDEDVRRIEFLDHFCSTLIGLDDAYHIFVEFKNDKGNIKNWKEVEDILETCNNIYRQLISKGYIYCLDPKMPQENTWKFIKWLNAKGIPCYGHMKSLIIHPQFKKKERIDSVLNIVRKLNGRIGSEFGIGILMKKYIGDGFREFARKSIAKHDPENIMNRGKII